MNKYELTLVVNAKIEDDERAQVIEKVKDLVTRFGGNVTDVDEWGKRRRRESERDYHSLWRYCYRSGRRWQEETCLRDPEDERRILLLRSVRCTGYLPGRS